MKTFTDLFALAFELQVKQHNLMENYERQKTAGIIDDDIIEEFNKIHFAVDTAYTVLEKCLDGE